jgi:hypothetical protein
MTPGTVAAVRPAVRSPEPAFFWIRYAPRSWPAPAGPWTDLGRACLGSSPARGPGAAVEGPLPELDGAPFDDVVWLPPVPAELRDERDRVAGALLAAGTPVLAQVLPGEHLPPAPAVAVHDLLGALLAAAAGGEAGEEGLAALAGLPSGAAVAWPLVPGLTDTAERVEAGLGRLVAAGVAVAQPVTPRLTPADRRRLAAAAPPSAFHRLFHGPDPDERAFAAAAARHGCQGFLPRPLPRPPLGGAGNRRLAAHLALAAELWLRLGRPPGQGQRLVRAARWIDETGYDLAAVAREGNLGVIEALDAFGRELVEEALATGGEPALLVALRTEYTEEITSP